MQWEERVDETRILTTEGQTTCLDPGRGWTIFSGRWIFLKKQECWQGHEQAQLLGRRLNEQKSWRKLVKDHQCDQYYEHCSRSIVPRELKEKQQYICPSFQLAGRVDLHFWGGEEGPTEVIWESLSEQEKGK